MTSLVAANRLISGGFVDKVLYISAHRATSEQWQHVSEGIGPWPINTADSVSITTTYAALARNPD
ncbi:MAG: hypothetical protein KDJ36_17670 [Hyphomicrobiaceae bacterium]|nr:hypothetical protein [Hyphomicrobiaceae bacterium]